VRKNQLAWRVDNLTRLWLRTFLAVDSVSKRLCDVWERTRLKLGLLAAIAIVLESLRFIAWKKMCRKDEPRNVARKVTVGLEDTPK